MNDVCKKWRTLGDMAPGRYPSGNTGCSTGNNDASCRWYNEHYHAALSATGKDSHPLMHPLYKARLI